jgi:hypothetical protein
MKLEIFEPRTLLAGTAGTLDDPSKTSWEEHSIQHESSSVQMHAHNQPQPTPSLLNEVLFITANLILPVLGFVTSGIAGTCVGQLEKFAFGYQQTQDPTLKATIATTALMLPTIAVINLGIQVIPQQWTSHSFHSLTHAASGTGATIGLTIGLLA